MRRRMYFLLPDLGSAIQTANDLLLARVEDGHMHFLAKRGMSLGQLHEANYLQKSDAVHGAELGFVLGGLGGFLIGIYIYLTPPEGVTLKLVTVLIATVLGAVFGAWAASLVAMSVPNTRLKPFQKDIDAGKFTLVVADTLKMQLELLRDGYSNALTGQRPFEMGEKSMDILLAIKKGEKVPEIVYTGLDLVTKDNVAQMLK